MNNSSCGPPVLGPLTEARERLAALLPPQADRILRALQHVQLALQYSDIEGRVDEVLEVSRDALRSLNQIDKPRELPPKVSVAVSTSRDAIVKAVRALERRAAQAGGGDTEDIRGGGPSDRRKKAIETDESADLHRRSDDDTWNVFAEELYADDFPDDADVYSRV